MLFIFILIKYQHKSLCVYLYHDTKAFAQPFSQDVCSPRQHIREAHILRSERWLAVDVKTGAIDKTPSRLKLTIPVYLISRLAKATRNWPILFTYISKSDIMTNKQTNFKDRSLGNSNFPLHFLHNVKYVKPYDTGWIPVQRLNTTSPSEWPCVLRPPPANSITSLSICKYIS